MMLTSYDECKQHRGVSGLNERLSCHFLVQEIILLKVISEKLRKERVSQEPWTTKLPQVKTISVLHAPHKKNTKIFEKKNSLQTFFCFVLTKIVRHIP